MIDDDIDLHGAETCRVHAAPGFQKLDRVVHMFQGRLSGRYAIQSHALHIIVSSDWGGNIEGHQGIIEHLHPGGETFRRSTQRTSSLAS